MGDLLAVIVTDIVAETDEDALQDDAKESEGFAD